MVNHIRKIISQIIIENKDSVYDPTVYDYFTYDFRI